MEDSPSNPPRQGSRFPRGPGPLVALSAVTPLAMMAAGLAYWWAGAAGADWRRLAVVMAGCAGAGIALGAVVLASASLLSVLQEIREALGRVERFQYEREGSSPARLDDPPSQRGGVPNGEPGVAEGGAAHHSGQWQELLLLVRDIRDNTLLSDEERSAKKLRVRDDELRQARTLLKAKIERGEFAEARQLAINVAGQFPGDPEAAALAGQVEQAREKRESSDIAQCVKQVNDLINISAWQRARALAEQLVEQHPESTDARQLVARIDRDFQLFQEQQRQRMYAEIQRYVSRRRWGEALAAAQTFIERFPSNEESEALRLQIPTLQQNAEIAVRQQLEQEIMELAKHGRYIEAEALARRVIEKYPTSPQAADLRKQLPRLAELAHNPSAPPARIRIDQ